MKPLLLHYYITNRCNARCSFCDIWTQQPKRDADIVEVFRNLKDARAAGCRFVDFTGGEPLLHPDLPRFLSKAREIGFITSVTTNCLLFKKRGRELKGLIDLLHFSIDGGSAEVHDTIRGVKSFDAVIESIAYALSLGMYPDLLFTYTNDNIHDFPIVANIARKNRLIAILDPVFSLNGRDECSPDTHAWAKKYSRMHGVYLNRAHLKLRQRGGNDTKSPRCRAVSSTIVILPDNHLALPCFHHNRFETPIHPDLSSILSQDIRTKALDNQGRYSFCDNCHINCYFDPSFTAVADILNVLSLAAKIRYSWFKHVIYRRPLPFSRLTG